MSSETKPDGGPAFPTDIYFDEVRLGQTAGLTLRDYFAAKFMARAQSLCETNGGWEMHNAAQCAYQMADEMLKARKP